MTKDVLVKISGLQTDIEDDDIEVISRGQYYFRNGKHYVIYEELLEDENNIYTGSLIKSTLKMTDKKVELLRKGITQSNMVFDLEKINYSSYSTPFGELSLEITTRKIELIEQETIISLKLYYSLSVNSQYYSECELKIEVKAVETDL